MNKKEIRKAFARIRKSEKIIEAQKSLVKHEELILVATCPFRQFDKIRIHPEARDAMVLYVKFGTFKGQFGHHTEDVPWKLVIVPYLSRGKELRSVTSGLEYIYSNNPKITGGLVEVLKEPHSEEAKERIRRRWKWVGRKPPVFPDEIPPVAVPPGHVLLGRGPLKAKPTPNGLDPKSQSKNLLVLFPDSADPAWEQACSGDAPNAFYAAKKNSKIEKANRP